MCKSRACNIAQRVRSSLSSLLLSLSSFSPSLSLSRSLPFRLAAAFSVAFRSPFAYSLALHHLRRMVVARLERIAMRKVMINAKSANDCASLILHLVHLKLVTIIFASSKELKFCQKKHTGSCQHADAVRRGASGGRERGRVRDREREREKEIRRADEIARCARCSPRSANSREKEQIEKRTMQLSIIARHLKHIGVAGSFSDNVARSNRRLRHRLSAAQAIRGTGQPQHRPAGLGRQLAPSAHSQLVGTISAVSGQPSRTGQRTSHASERAR